MNKTRKNFCHNKVCNLVEVTVKFSKRKVDSGNWEGRKGGHIGALQGDGTRGYSSRDLKSGSGKADNNMMKMLGCWVIEVFCFFILLVLKMGDNKTY